MCDCDKTLMRKVFKKEQFYFSNEPVIEDVEYVVTYDSRGYIRLGQEDDMGCLDHFDKFKVNYCPFCGVRVD